MPHPPALATSRSTENTRPSGRRQLNNGPKPALCPVIYPSPPNLGLSKLWRCPLGKLRRRPMNQMRLARYPTVEAVSFPKAKRRSRGFGHRLVVSSAALEDRRQRHHAIYRLQPMLPRFRQVIPSLPSARLLEL